MLQTIYGLLEYFIFGFMCDNIELVQLKKKKLQLPNFKHFAFFYYMTFLEFHIELFIHLAFLYLPLIVHI